MPLVANARKHPSKWAKSTLRKRCCGLCCVRLDYIKKVDRCLAINYGNELSVSEDCAWPNRLHGRPSDGESNG